MSAAFRDIISTSSCSPSTDAASEILPAVDVNADEGDAVQYMGAFDELAGSPGGGSRQGGGNDGGHACTTSPARRSWSVRPRNTA
jgi:hypothetical protein